MDKTACLAARVGRDSVAAFDVTIGYEAPLNQAFDQGPLLCKCCLG